MRVMIALCSALMLTGCFTGQPTCTSPAARELRTVDRLIADTRTNIARGYTTDDAPRSGFNVCLGGGGDNVGVSFCADPGRRTVAIDRAAEQRKLDGLMQRRAALAKQAAVDSEACAAATGGI